MAEEELLAAWEESIELLDAYESLLSLSQRETLTMYFRYNLSLGEIAEEKGISRAATFDALKKGAAKLRDYESKLGLAKKTRAAKEAAAIVSSSLTLEEAKASLAILQEAFDDGI